MSKTPASLEDCGWLQDQVVQALMRALQARGADVRFVGGCVRAALLDEPVGDIDIAIDVPPDETIALLTAAEIKHRATGIEHGTVMAVIEGRGFEITSLRVDVATDGRHAEVAFGTDWEADAKRRDFTMNALYAGVDGEVYDPLGGYEDLINRRVRFVGDAALRIAEDYLRILRFFRFFAQYGTGQPDPQALAACRHGRSGLGQLSAERVRAELWKLLVAPGAKAAVQAMVLAGVAAMIFPGQVDSARLARLIEAEDEAGLKPDPARRLAALVGQGAVTAAADLKCSNRDRERISDLINDAEKQGNLDGDQTLISALYYFGSERAIDQLVMRAADQGAAVAKKIAWAQAWVRPRFPVTGHTLQALGVEPGPRLGKVLKALETWWVDAGFPDDETVITRKLDELIKAAG